MRLTALLLAAVLRAAPAPLAPVALPGAEGEIGFDDLRFSPELRRVLVPAGRSGRLDLVDPSTLAVESVAGFSAEARGGRGHSQGTTSADSGSGLVFASDRTERTLVLVDPGKKRIVARARLGGVPDYVRWVAPRREVWVTEPGQKRIEIFDLERQPAPGLRRAGAIEVPDGPESLEIDPGRRRAYTNTWHDATIAIDLGSRALAARWNNGCEGARGLALDAERGFALVGCEEGRAVALDVVHGGKPLGSVPAGRGVDVIAYSDRLSHLYLPAAGGGELTVVGVGAHGELAVLGAVGTAPGAHCVAADDAGNAYICDPANGRLLVFRDPYPPSR